MQHENFSSAKRVRRERGEDTRRGQNRKKKGLENFSCAMIDFSSVEREGIDPLLLMMQL